MAEQNDIANQGSAVDSTDSSDFITLRDELLTVMRATGMPAGARSAEDGRVPESIALDDTTFDDLARRCFAFQFGHNAPYRAYCERRGVRPVDVTSWTDIPAVPTAAFREVPLNTAATAAVVFRTSGTTGGAERRGEHYVRDLALYDASLRASFDMHVLPDDARLPMLALVPPRAQLPDSSLSYMVEALVRDRGAAGSRYAMDVDDGLDVEAAVDWLRAAEADGAAVCILGTSFAFVHLLDALAARKLRFALAPGSRLMDTGGYKGRSREVPPDALRASYAERFALPADHCVNEYGMTELCSQYYDRCLLDAHRAATPSAPASDRDRRKHGPPWLRARVVDPETLKPLPDGDVGILQHFDLANLGSVSAVQTEDLGVIVDGGFRLLGRTPGAVPRGCSIALDVLLQR